MSADLPAADDTSQKPMDVKAILDALRGLRFGSVTVIVQDGVIVQIDRTEKRRIRRASGSDISTNQG